MFQKTTDRQKVSGFHGNQCKLYMSIDSMHLLIKKLYSKRIVNKLAGDRHDMPPPLSFPRGRRSAAEQTAM